MMSLDSLTNGLIQVVAFIVAVGVLVAVHEFGHFWVARRLGIKVLRFSIGFGKPLWQRIAGKDRVEFVIAAVPLGGYVKLLDEREGDVRPEDVPRAFNRQPVWKRIAVLLAGPAFNLLFAILLYSLLYTAGVPAAKPIIGYVAPDTIAARGGLRFEDEIIEVAGRKVATLEAATLGIIDELVGDGMISLKVRDPDGYERTLELNAGGPNKSRELTQPDALFSGLGFRIWRPRVEAVIKDITPDSSAAKAGLKAGDRIVSFDGTPISEFDQLVFAVEPSAGRTVDIEVERGGERVTRQITIDGLVNEGGRRIGRLGITPDAQRLLPTRRAETEFMTMEKFSAPEAVSRGVQKTWDTS